MKKHSHSLAVIFLLLAGLLISSANAKEATRVTHVDPPSSILFVGNSFTFYNNAIYTHLRGLQVAENPANRRAYFLRSMTISGAHLRDHRGGLKQMLEFRDWDLVVLQGRSREPIDEEMAPGFKAAVTEFAQLIRESGATPVLFMTWAYAHRPEMTAELASAFDELGAELNMMVIPVGLAFEKALAEIPDAELHSPDKIHPSLAGTYLAAAVFYSALYNQPPEELEYTAGLDDSLARKLRQVAWQTTRDYYSR